MKRNKRNSPAFLIVLAATAFLLVSCDKGSENREKDVEEVIETEEAVEISGESIYQLDGEWHNQDSDTISLSQLRGKIPVIAMVFTHCGYACPRIVADLQNIEEQVPKEKKDEVVFVLASFDTERDHPVRLRKFAEEMDLDEDWLLLHGEEDVVRELSMVLDVKYKKQRDGNFAHSNNIVLLDKEGVIVEQIEGLGVDPASIVEEIAEL